VWIRNNVTGAEFYVTNEAHQRRLLAHPNYKVFEPVKKGKKAKGSGNEATQPAEPQPTGE